MSQLSLGDEIAASINAAAPAPSPVANATGEGFNPAIHAVDAKTGKPIPIKGGGFRKKPVFKTAPKPPVPGSSAPKTMEAKVVAAVESFDPNPPGAPRFTPAAAAAQPAPGVPPAPSVSEVPPDVAARRLMKVQKMFLKGPLALSKDEEIEWEVALVDQFTESGKTPQVKSWFMMSLLSIGYVFDRWESLKAKFTKAPKKGQEPAPSPTPEPSPAPSPETQHTPVNGVPAVLLNPSNPFN